MDQTWYVAGAPHGVPTFKDIVTKYSINQAKDFLKEADPFHQAESGEEYWQRWDKGIAEIKASPLIKDNSNVLLISHGNAVLSLVERFGQGKYDITKRPANGSVTQLTVSDDDIVVTSYNQ